MISSQPPLFLIEQKENRVAYYQIIIGQLPQQEQKVEIEYLILPAGQSIVKPKKVENLARNILVRWAEKAKLTVFEVKCSELSPELAQKFGIALPVSNEYGGMSSTTTTTTSSSSTHPSYSSDELDGAGETHSHSTLRESPATQGSDNEYANMYWDDNCDEFLFAPDTPEPPSEKPFYHSNEDGFHSDESLSEISEELSPQEDVVNPPCDLSGEDEVEVLGIYTGPRG